LSTAPRTPLDHAGQDARAQVGDGLDVGADHRQLAAGVAAVYRPDRAQPGVVDQHVGREAALRYLLDEPQPGLGVGQVGRDHLGPDGVGCGQLSRQLTQAVVAPGDQRDPETPLGRPAPDPSADARGSPGHDARAFGCGGRQCHASGW
jgi:hypothetical protein